MTEPREVTVKRWRCAFCPRGYSRRKLAVEHMDGCRDNPANAERLARANEEDVSDLWRHSSDDRDV